MADTDTDTGADETAATDAETGGTGTDEGAGDDFDKDRAMATIHKLREAEKEGKRAAKERDDLTKRLKQLEDAQLSEQEKQTQRLTELEAEKLGWAAERQEMRLRLAVHAKAGVLGVADTDLALAALDRTKIEYGDDGEPSNVTDVLAALLEAKPLLKGKPAAAAVPSTNAASGQTPVPAPALTADELAAANILKMDAGQYAAMKNVSTIDEYQALRAKQTATT